MVSRFSIRMYAKPETRNPKPETTIFATRICHMNPAVISFDNTANAFEYKTDAELKRAKFLFASMGKSWLVKWGTKFTPWAMKIGLPLNGMIRRTIFQQFVGGET